MKNDKGLNTAVLAIKALAIVGVIFHHVGNGRLLAEVRENFQVVTYYFGWCVLAFILIAGYLQAKSEQRNKWSLGSFSIHRAKRLLIPFILLVILYAFVWQGIQQQNYVKLNGVVPKDFGAKLTNSLWPTGKNTVAEQLYFLPLLFGISVLFKTVLSVFKKYGSLSLLLVALTVGCLFFQRTSNTGFNWSVFTWGVAFYSIGFLFAGIGFRARLFICISLTLLLGACCGEIGIIRTAPVWLFTFLDEFNLKIPNFISSVGEASGSIYAYHTPFVIQPAMIVVAFLPTFYLQSSGIVVAVAMIVAGFTIFHLILARTKLRWMLL